MNSAVWIEAMGQRAGDTLVLENQWVAVEIQREGSNRYTSNYIVREQGSQRGTHHSTIMAAVFSALAILAKFEHGRCD